MLGESDDRAVGAHPRLRAYKLLPKALKGKMNVAVILNPRVQLYVLLSVDQWMLCLIWTFFYILNEQLRCCFFLFLKHLNEQKNPF